MQNVFVNTFCEMKTQALTSEGRRTQAGNARKKLGGLLLSDAGEGVCVGHWSPFPGKTRGRNSPFLRKREPFLREKESWPVVAEFLGPTVDSVTPTGSLRPRLGVRG